MHGVAYLFCGIKMIYGNKTLFFIEYIIMKTTPLLIGNLSFGLDW